MTSFNVDGHIASRQDRHQKSNIHNKYLTGLATIELNITELCNRTCSFCPRHDPSVYPNQKLFMELVTVKALVAQLKKLEWYGDIHITGFGEPHTHPQLLEIVEILNTHDGLYIEITSNGDRLIDSRIDYTHKLYEAGLDQLTIDCYDDEEQYVTRSMVMLDLPGKWRLRAHYDVGDTQELIVKYGYNNRAGTMGGEGIQGQCYLPFYKAFIDWDGEVRLCCNDWHREAGTMGNILVDEFAECWKSQRLSAIRQQLSKGNREGVCSGCNINGKKFGKESHDLLAI